MRIMSIQGGSKEGIYNNQPGFILNVAVTVYVHEGRLMCFEDRDTNKMLGLGEYIWYVAVNLIAIRIMNGLPHFNGGRRIGSVWSYVETLFKLVEEGVC